MVDTCPTPIPASPGGVKEINRSFWSTLCSKNSETLGLLPLPFREGGRGVR
jgi:hypothetical protein